VDPLVEREVEVATLDALLESARSGAGAVVLVEGPPGIGKTSLLRAARERAAAEGMRVLHGRGTELERAFPLGVARQCLEPVVRDPAERERVLSGAARLAEPVLLDAPESVPASSLGLLHGLYWLVANLAEQAPVLLAVDDAQWADEPSLRFLAYLGRRAESLPLALVVAARDDADVGEQPTLVELRAEPAAHTLAPAVLTVAGVGGRLAELPNGPVDDAFVWACHEATGGNPFLLDELVRTLQREGVAFAAAGAPRVHEVTPPTVARAVAATLARLGPQAAALAQAAGVLGDAVALDLAAELADVPMAAAGPAASDLVRAGLLEDAAALRFRHPMLTGAVRASLPAPERAAAHARAAALLRGRGAGPERVALQLLHAVPAGDARVVAELVEAATRAAERGAPATAAALLRRARAEPPPAEQRADVLLELGRHELATGRANAATDHLEEAHRCAGDARTRGAALTLLVQTNPGDRHVRARVVARAEEELPALEAEDRELGLRLRALLVLDGEHGDQPLLPGDTLGEAAVMGSLVFGRASVGASAAEVADVAQRAARQAEALLAAEGTASLPFTGAVVGLRWADRLDAALALTDRGLAAARRSGSVIDFAAALTLRATVLRRAGRLREAEADARVALEAALDPAVAFARGVGPLAGTLLDRGRVDDAAREFTAVVPEDIPDSPPMTPVLLARMALRAARREHALALADWEEALRRTPRGPTPAWIEDLAVAAGVHQALGDGDATQALVDQADALAQTWDTPTARAEVLLARARLTEVDAAVDLLRVAVAELEGTPTRLIEARAQVDLGGALRRRGHRVESREPLRAGYELARACGADGLAETARAELRASGIRLRREAASGADALTPSERRIAELAAAGMSNAEVAQELFLTVKTVEMHLTHTYRKLDIRGRSELAQALGSKP